MSYEFPPYGGGEAVYTYDLMKALQSRGADVMLITAHHSKLTNENNHSTVSVNSITIPGLKTTSFMLRASRKLREISKDFDVVHYTNDYCGFGSSRARLGRPVLATIHHTHSLEAASVSPYLNEGPFRRIAFKISETLTSRMEKSTLKNADGVVAVSEFTAKNALAIYPFLKDKVSVVHDAVDDTRFSPNINPESFRKAWNLGNCPTVVYVGRLAASKGLRFLIDSFKEVLLAVPDAKLVLVGSGSKQEQSNIISQISKLELRSSVILTGRISAEDLPKAYAASDLVVLPSLVEGFGLVLLEAMASCKPVVATTLGPTEEIIKDGEEGILIQKGDSHMLAESIKLILQNKTLANRMGLRGRRKIEEQFSMNRWSAQMLEIYRELE